MQFDNFAFLKGRFNGNNPLNSIVNKLFIYIIMNDNILHLVAFLFKN